MSSESAEKLTVSQRWLQGVREFQSRVKTPVEDATIESPAEALQDLHNAIQAAPASYRGYLSEALGCYENGHYRAAILLVWSAVVARLYDAVGDHPGGIKALEKANLAHFGGTQGYKRIRKRDDLMYLRDRSFIELAEAAGLYNRTTRKLLLERLDLRNDCGHPTGYQVARAQTVIFIESLCQNILSGQLLNWK